MTRNDLLPRAALTSETADPQRAPAATEANASFFGSRRRTTTAPRVAVVPA